MKKKQILGVFLILIGLLHYLFMEEFLYFLYSSYFNPFESVITLINSYYSYHLPELISIAIFGLGIKFILPKNIRLKERSNPIKTFPENNDKFSEAGNYLIKSSIKLFIALTLNVCGVILPIFMTLNTKNVTSVEDAQQLTVTFSSISTVISIIGLILGILSILDIRKAGESLKK
jgi:hypothetical protein